MLSIFCPWSYRTVALNVRVVAYSLWEIGYLTKTKYPAYKHASSSCMQQNNLLPLFAFPLWCIRGTDVQVLRTILVQAFGPNKKHRSRSWKSQFASDVRPFASFPLLFFQISHNRSPDAFSNSSYFVWVSSSRLGCIIWIILCRGVGYDEFRIPQRHCVLGINNNEIH